MLCGFDAGFYASLARRYPDLQVQASGGACSLEDLRAVRRVGAAGAVLGRALLEKRFALAEALAC